MTTKAKVMRALDYFPCQAPPGALFKSRTNDLRGIAELSRTNQNLEILELIKIGLTAYFEAFCKDQFGSMICLAPTLIKNLSVAGKDTTLDASLMVDDFHEFNRQIGFYISEKYDFGTPQKVNSLFKSLIGITPFSSKNLNAYDAILHDRNLLAHHGGTYTTSYVRNTKSPNLKSTAKAFQDGIVVNPDQILKDIDLVDSIAYSMTVSCHKSIVSHLQDNSIRLDAQKKQALDFLLWWEEG